MSLNWWYMLITETCLIDSGDSLATTFSLELRRIKLPVDSHEEKQTLVSLH